MQGQVLGEHAAALILKNKANEAANSLANAPLTTIHVDGYGDVQIGKTPIFMDQNSRSDNLAPGTHTPSGLHNGALDAFRHAYAAALIASRMGENAAIVYGDYYEAVNPNPKSEEDMDKNNNAIGAHIGQENEGKSEFVVMAAVWNALLQGWLQVATNHTPIPYGDDTYSGTPGGVGEISPIINQNPAN